MIRERLHCSEEDVLIHVLLADKVAAARPDVVIMLRWPEVPLGRNFWDIVNLPRDLSIPNSIGAKVFYLTDTTVEDFPNSPDPVKRFYDRTREEGESGDFIEVKLWLMRENFPPILLSTARFPFQMIHTAKQVRFGVRLGYLRVLECALDKIRDPVKFVQSPQ